MMLGVMMRWIDAWIYIITFIPLIITNIYLTIELENKKYESYWSPVSNSNRSHQLKCGNVKNNKYVYTYYMVITTLSHLHIYVKSATWPDVRSSSEKPADVLNSSLAKVVWQVVSISTVLTVARCFWFRPADWFDCLTLKQMLNFF